MRGDGAEILDEVLAQASQSATEAPPAAKGIRGFGAPYLRGRIWWIRYSHNGHEYRESAKSEREVDAQRLLKARWKQIGRGRFIGPREDKVLMGDLLDGLELDYAQNGRRSADTLKGRLEPLRAAFGTVRAVDVKGADVERYKAARLAAKSRKGGTVAPATVNRELAALKRAFRLGVEQERIATAPAIKLLAEHNVREGFVEPGQFAEIANALPDPLDDVARFLYTTGWRKKEVLTLRWSDVDLGHRLLRLRAEHSKNEQPRVIVLTDELLALVERRWAARQYRVGEVEAISEWVFHRNGRPIVDFRKRWDAARKAANAQGLLVHDLRRSSVRNMMKSREVDQAVAMRITGHLTDSVFRRYRIVDEGDIERALAATQAATRQAPPVNVVSLRTAQEGRP